MAAPRRIQKPMPLRGRYTSAPADVIGQEHTPNALNIRFRFGQARSGPGRGFYDHPVGGGKALRIDNFSLSTDTIWPIEMTESKLFRRGNLVPGDVDDWFEIAGTFVPSDDRRWTVASGEDRFFFSRGTEQIAQWNGIGGDQFDFVKNVVGFEGITGGTECVAARCLEYFNNRLIAANVIEGSTTKSNRIRWSQNGDFRKWNDLVQLGAGFLDLNDEGAESILSMKALGNRCITYRKHSIGQLVPTGSLSPTHIHETIIRNRGIGAPYTLDSSGDAHFYLGSDKNVWMFDGQRTHPVGDPVHEELMSLVYLDAIEKYFGRCIPSRFEYWLLLCDDVRGIFDAFIYDYLRNYWTRETFANLFTIGEVEIPLPIYTWNTIPGVWNDWGNTTWADLGASSMTAMLGGRTDSAIMRIDEQFAYDYFAIGSIIDRVLETEDMYVDLPSDLARVVRLLLVYEFVSSEPFEVSISLDRGRTWLSKEVVPEERGYSWVDFISTGNVIRFRFRENNATGQFRWNRYVYEVFNEGEYIGTTTG